MAEQITLNPIADITQSTSAQNTINANNAVIETAFLDVLSLTGTSPNQMQSQLDLNNNQILNLPQPATANSPLRLQDLSSFTGGGTVSNIPTGGTTGQVLAKNSNTNFDTGWISESSDLVAGTNIAITGSSPATISTISSPSFTAPNLGTPSAVVLTNATGTASGLTSGNVTTNANLTGPITSSGNVTSVASQTGTGSTFVMNTSPTLITPALGTPASGVLTNCTGTAAGLTAGTATTATTANAVAAGNITGTTLASGVTASSLTSFGTSPTLVTPNIGVATATSVNKLTVTAPATSATLTIANGTTLTETTSTSIGQGQYLGTATNDNATAGNIGEFISSTSSAVGLTSGTTANLTSISLTAGDWDIDSVTSFQVTGTTSLSGYATSISTTSATTNGTLGFFASNGFAATIPGGAFSISASVPPARLSLNATTTVFLTANSTFTVSTNTATGIIRARRVR